MLLAIGAKVKCCLEVELETPALCSAACPCLVTPNLCGLSGPVGAAGPRWLLVPDNLTEAVGGGRASESGPPELAWGANIHPCPEQDDGSSARKPMSTPRVHRDPVLPRVAQTLLASCPGPRKTSLSSYSLVPGPAPTARPAPCCPCSDAEVLLAVCTSDFVVRGSIQNVTHAPEQQESTIHLHVSRLYRQKSRVFRPAPEGGGWRGRVATLLECGVRPGRGEFLFTGHMHFGEARLGCAPRFKDFQRMYRDAKERGLNPCEMGTE
ncbi:meteorin-like protein isoform X1 [Callorhinus ursinus]|uniref:meteorin-like protein isoform X1 n=1 Tax=Callorhinus ursinus TaxID=34884 RepID=UPI003CD03838